MLTLTVLPETFAICCLSADEIVPDWAMLGEFVSITHTSDELSIVCAAKNVPPDVRADRGWRALKVEGPLGALLKTIGTLPVKDIEIEEAKLEDVILKYYRDGKQ